MATKQVLQVSILERFLKKDTLEKLIEDYRDNRKSGRIIRQPSASDLKLHKLVQEHQSMGVVAKKVGISSYKVMSALIRVAAYKK